MSWDKTYSHTLLLALDRFGAAILFNEPDITISSLCWIVLTRDKYRAVYAADPIVPSLDRAACVSFNALKLSGWQLWMLRQIGNSLLENFWPGHCQQARQGDLDTSARSRLLLGA